MMAPRAPARARVHRHPMRVVMRRTGLSAELLRVWERRHHVVTPGRTQTGRRLYSDAEIERLRLLYRATLAGRSIGLIAGLSMPALAALVRQDAEAEQGAMRAPVGPPNAPEAGRFVDQALRAVERFDALALDAALRRAVVALSAVAFLDDVVAVVLERVGARWRDGTLRPAHGHFTTAVVRRVLDRVTETTSVPGAAPRVLLATPAGQLHELGAMLAAAAAAAEGWSVTYLGANVPAEDIAEAAVAIRARVVGLSLVHPPNDRGVSHELRRLRTLLPVTIALVVGGAAAGAYRDVLDEIGAKHMSDLRAWRADLEKMSRRRWRAG